MLGFGRRRLKVNLALQGGGAHGAFTWGVLDQLLDEPDLDFGWISGTSAGAVNAVAMVSGFAEGGRSHARDRLRSVWEAVQEAGVPDLLRLNPFLSTMSRSPTLGQIGTLFSPYEFNPLGFDPLRKLLEGQIDFARLRAFEANELLIAATDVATGQKRLFRRAEMSVEAVLASTCLPTLHHAVTIDGRAYWDGGFSSNPDLVTLASESPVRDTLLVLLNPVEKAANPRSARDIALEVSRVTFSRPLLQEVAEIAAAVAEPSRSFWRRRASRSARIAAHRFHLIEAGRHTENLPADSKLRPDRDMLRYLHAAGREEARRWIGRTRSSIGKASSIDLPRHFARPFTPLAVPEPVAGTQAEADASAIAEKL